MRFLSKALDLFLPRERNRRAACNRKVFLILLNPRSLSHHTIQNISTSRKKWAAWSVTSVDKGGIEIIPLSQRQTGVLPNRQIILWPYTDISDTRLILKNSHALLVMIRRKQPLSKLAVITKRGGHVMSPKVSVFIRRFSLF